MSQASIRVLIVDDSAVVRQGLSSILSKSKDIEVVGSAPDPFAAAEKLSRLEVDVIMLDVEMPRMDGITFLKKIMSQHPMPVVICSSLVDAGSDTHVRALEYGAVAIVAKPKMGTKAFIEDSAVAICDAVRGAAHAKVKLLGPSQAMRVTAKLSADAVIPQKRGAISAKLGRSGQNGSEKQAESKGAMLETTDKVIVLGASTGGTEAIRTVLQALPADCPPVAIVQHMPEGFTRSFAARLNEICAINVKEASCGDRLLNGHALIAPGNQHMLLARSGAQYQVKLKDGPLVSRHRPSVDVLFRSASQVLGRNGIGAILTGMGDDGAKGMLELLESGAQTFAQDEASCVVYGMPKEAVKAGGVQKQVSLVYMAANLLKAAK